jgi:hypothetical protein
MAKHQPGKPEMMISQTLRATISGVYVGGLKRKQGLN